MLQALLIPLLLIGPQEPGQTYTDKERGFTVPIPKGWTLQKPTPEDPRLILKAPAEDRSGATLILVTRESMKAVYDRQVSLDRFLEAVKEQYPTRFKDFEFKKAKKGKKGRILTLGLTYIYTSSDQKIGQYQFLVWTRNHHYSLTWGCLASKFDENRELFEKTSAAFSTRTRK